MFDKLKAMLIKKREKAKPSDTCGAKDKSAADQLKDAILETTGGNKTKFHKRLNKHHKTLKRKLRL
jgi:ActR/RegA family two-component response regulator